MNLPLLASQIGLPKNGLIALYDPWRDVAGRNILPVGALSTWSKTRVTMVGDYLAETSDPTTHILTPGVSIPLNGQRCAFCVVAKKDAKNWIKLVHYNQYANFNLNTGTIGNKSSGVTANINYVGDGKYQCSIIWDTTMANSPPYIALGDNNTESWDDSYTGDGVSGLYVYLSQLNLSQLYPYAAPTGLPQSATDYSGNGNAAQLGSTSGADTNDPIWNGNGWVLGSDDYCIGPSAGLLDITGSFTQIIVVNASVTPTSQIGVFTKDAAAIGRGYGIYQNATTGLPIAQVRIGGSWLNTILSPTNLNGSTQFLWSRYNGTSLDGGNGAIKYSSVAASGAVASNTEPLYLGTFSGSSAYFNGKIYIAAVYNRALSNTECVRAYNYLKRYLNSKGVSIA